MNRISYVLVFILMFGCSSGGSSDDGNMGGGGGDDTVTPTCSAISNFMVSGILDTSAMIDWSHNESDTSFEIEYGEAGFQLGNGITATSAISELPLNGLSPITDYEVYIKANCTSDTSSAFSGPFTFTTQSSCLAPAELGFNALSYCTISLTWDTSTGDTWEIEWGAPGFTPGIGEGELFEATSTAIAVGGLQETTYDIYIRTKCGPDDYSAYTGPLTATTLEMGWTGTYIQKTGMPGVYGSIFGAPGFVELEYVSKNTRKFTATYYEDSNDQGQQPIEFMMVFECFEGVIVPNQDTTFSCGNGNVFLGPSADPTNFSFNDDSQIAIRFEEFDDGSTGGCAQAISDNEVELILTKF